MKRSPVLSTSGLSRRAALGRVAAVGAALGLGSRLGRVAAQEATPSAMASHPLVGAWIVDRNPDDPTELPTTNVLTPDGLLIDPSVGVAGVWEATGERTGNFTLTAIFTEGGGGYAVAHGVIEVDAGGDTATVTYSDLAVSPDGTVLGQSEQNTGRYLRVRLIPPDSALKPLAGFPAWTPTPPATPTA